MQAANAASSSSAGLMVRTPLYICMRMIWPLSSWLAAVTVLSSGGDIVFKHLIYPFFITEGELSYHTVLAFTIFTIHRIIRT